MSGEWAASVKSNIGLCMGEEGEHSTPIFINIARYKAGAAAATKTQPLLFWPLHATSDTATVATTATTAAVSLTAQRRERFL